MSTETVSDSEQGNTVNWDSGRFIPPPSMKYSEMTKSQLISILTQDAYETRNFAVGLALFLSALDVLMFATMLWYHSWSIFFLFVIFGLLTLVFGYDIRQSQKRLIARGILNKDDQWRFPLR